MTETPADEPTRPISVAELLARHGNIGSPPVTGRKRRRLSNADAVSVAELTGEIPVIRDEDLAPAKSAPPAETKPAPPTETKPAPTAETKPANETRPTAKTRPADSDAEDRAEPMKSPQPHPRWPQSPSQTPRKTGPQRSHHPLPARRPDSAAKPAGAAKADEAAKAATAAKTDAAAQRASEVSSDAERMSPDPLDGYDAVSVADIETGEVGDAVETAEAPARRGGRGLLGTLRGGFSRRATTTGADSELDEDLEDLEELEELDELEEQDADDAVAAVDAATDVHADEADQVEDLEELDHLAHADATVGHESVAGRLLRGGWIVVQSALAVAFGAGLFIAFDQLWRWNSVVALVLTVLVTLGLVAVVQAVRKTVDISSTLIAVAVGLLVTLGPLVLWLSG